VGAVGSDRVAASYADHLRSHGVQPHLIAAPGTLPSAVCVCLVTPDGQRTMRTCLGASAQLAASDLPAPLLRSCQWVHCEGYMLYKPKVLRSAIAIGQEAGATVSLDLASFEVIRSCEAVLRELLGGGGVDVVFCNEDEAAALAAAVSDGAIPERAVARASGDAAGSGVSQTWGTTA
jgi:sugar/nucleoside kinase (ribokinase family)